MALPQMSAAQKKRLQIHPAGLLITLLSFGAWVVALGGVGGATQNCVNGGISAATSATPGASVQCAKIYQWEWWGLWFEACLLVSLFVASFFEAFNRGKQIFISYYIMCTCVLMWGAHNFITSSQLGSTGWKISDKQQVANNAGAAGYTILCIFNYCLLIILGYEGDITAAARGRPQPEDVIPMSNV